MKVALYIFIVILTTVEKKLEQLCMKACKVIFRDETLAQDSIVDCWLNDVGDLEFKLYFDPPVTENSNLGSLSGQLCYAFCKALKDE